MSFEFADNITSIVLNAVMTLALAGLLLLLGYYVRKKIPALAKYCIPAPVIGGFIFMFVTFAGHVTGAFQVKFTNIFQDYFMLAFFTTVGLGASLKLLKKGGLLLIVYWLCCGVISVFQNLIGIGVGTLVGVEAPYALLASAISMIGGHGAALSYGGDFVRMGYPHGTLVGAAAATFGLISAVLVGGPLGRSLIERYQLKPEENQHNYDDIKSVNAATGGELTGLDIMTNVVAIIVCMAIGTQVSGAIGKLIGMSFPTYVGSMFTAVIVRNINDSLHLYKFSFPLVDGIGDVMLNLYLSLAMMTLALWDLSGLIGGLLIVLVCQVVFMVCAAYFVVFRILGKNYDAAVMCAGLCGHGLGATPSAIVNMTAVCERYGMSSRAFMIVPIVGAFLVDIIYQPQTLTFIKFFVKGFGN